MPWGRRPYPAPLDLLLELVTQSWLDASVLEHRIHMGCTNVLVSD